MRPKLNQINNIQVENNETIIIIPALLKSDDLAFSLLSLNNVFHMFLLTKLEILPPPFIKRMVDKRSIETNMINPIPVISKINSIKIYRLQVPKILNNVSYKVI